MFRLLIGMTCVLLPASAFAGVSQVHKTEYSTPESLVRAYGTAIQKADWEYWASLFHPDTTNRVYAVVRSIASSGDRSALERFGIGPDMELESLSAPELMAHVMTHLSSQNPNAIENVQMSEIQVIGSVNEGDVAHVVYRVTLDIVAIGRSPRVLSCKRYRSGWRILTEPEFVDHFIAPE